MSTLRSIIVFPFLTATLVACSAAESTGEEPTGEIAQAASKEDPCATVRCAAGFRCVAKGRRAACVADAPSCTTDADCRLFDDFCDGCSCRALLTSAPAPVCGGTTVQCFMAPCTGKTATCESGACVVSSTTF